MNFKFLDFENYQQIQNIIKSRIPTNLFTASSSSVSYPSLNLTNIPELVTEMGRMGLLQFWRSSAVIVVKPAGSLPIHVDSGNHVWSLNFPIHNTANTFTVYYNTNIEPTEMEATPGSSAYKKFFPEDCIESEEKFELNRPVLMRTDIPHTVINNNSEARISIGFRLNLDFDPSTLKI